jgi:hypothetical protein
MAILPTEVVRNTPPLHTQDKLPDEQLTAYARLTVSEIGYTWFLLELHTDEDTFSAYLIDLQKEQFGYFSFSYLEEHLGIAAIDILGEIPGTGTIVSLEEVPSIIEYDQNFSPKPLVEAVREERIRRWLAHGGGLYITDSIAPHRAYYYAASFPRSATAQYRAIRNIIHTEPVNLSAFHVLPPTLPTWHIVIMGDRPSEAVHERFMSQLQKGTLTIIPYDLLMQLFARKIEQNIKGPWQEGHTNIKLRSKGKQTKKKRDTRHRRNRRR